MTQKIDGTPPVAPRPNVASAAKTERAGLDRSAPVAETAAADSVSLTGEAASLQALERQMTSTPVMDMDKVNAVRSALAAGTYKIDAAQIASRMVALDREFTA